MFNNPSFLLDLASSFKSHGRGENYFNSLEANLLDTIDKVHNSISSAEISFAELGLIKFPFFEMGQINSTKLFGLDELILFSFYYANRNRYKKTLDLGANIGLHTLIMKKLGLKVTSYEPDSVHLAQIKKVMKLNELGTEGLTPKAISDKRGTMEYIRILGNTTGSHLLGSKEEVYGATEIVSVEVDDILEVLDKGKFDFVKMDVEGHELSVLKGFDLQKYSPDVVTLEFLEKDIFLDNNIDNIVNSEIYKYMILNRYKFVNWINSDLFFIRENYYK